MKRANPEREQQQVSACVPAPHPEAGTPHILLACGRATLNPRVLLVQLADIVAAVRLVRDRARAIAVQLAAPPPGDRFEFVLTDELLRLLEQARAHEDWLARRHYV